MNNNMQDKKTVPVFGSRGSYDARLKGQKSNHNDSREMD